MPRINSGNIAIDYLDTGVGPPVILIPCSGSGNRQWRKLVSEMSGRYRMISMNLFGYGETSVWSSEKLQTLKDPADLVIALANRLEGPLSLIGHSFGGSVAMKAALTLEERLRSLVLIEPNPFYLLKDYGRIEAYQEICLLGDFVKKFGALGEWNRVASRFVTYWNSDGAWEALSEERQAILAELVKPNFYEWDAVLEGEDDISEWQRLSDRMLVLKGSETRRAISEIVELLTNDLPNLNASEVPGCGHMLPITHPHLVNPIIGNFLDRQKHIQTQ